MGKWPCWFYDCQADCDHQVCEQLPDVSNSIEREVWSVLTKPVSSGLWFSLLVDSFVPTPARSSEKRINRCWFALKRCAGGVV